MSSGHLIMICDDQQIIHETLRTYLASEGFDCISAYDGEQAISVFKENDPDLVILDIMMPRKNGMDVCREIRQESRVPIIMLTAKSEEIDRVLGLELGADDYIVKPFSARDEIRRARDQHKQLRRSLKRRASAADSQGGGDIPAPCLASRQGVFKGKDTLARLGL